MNTQPNNLTRNLRRRSLGSATLLALLLLLATAPGMAAVRASLDRNMVYEDDTVTLTIENDSPSSNLQPNLTPLKKDFEVLGTSTSTQLSIYNGRRSDKTRWHVQLQPRRLGQLRIPPIDVGGEKTAAITLKVSEAPQQTAARTGSHVFIEAETGSGDTAVYVQQQIPYTVRLYYDDRLQEGELNAPEPENAVVERLGEEKRYDTVRNGREYHVIERNYVISAEKSGALHIPPASFRGRIAVPRQQRTTRRPRSPMEEFLDNSPFANDPFFRDRLGGGLFANPVASTSQPIRVRGRTIDLTIKPRPAAVRQNWLPAEAVTLIDSWTENPPQLKIGEPVSRTITIQAKGLSGSQIPELSLAAPTKTRIYPEASEHENRTDGQTIYGLRTQTLTYIPAAQGTLDIPPVTLIWWDTRHDQAASTTLPAWQLNVQPGAPGTANNTPTAPSTAQSPVERMTKTSPDTEVVQKSRDVLAILREAAQTHQRWVLIGGMALILLLSILARRTKRHQTKARFKAAASAKMDSPVSENHKQPNPKTVLRTLEQACAGNDRQAVARALLELGQAKWPDDPPRSLDALAARIETGQTQIDKLDRSLYAATGTNWNGAALWNVFRHGLQTKKTESQRRDDGLKPLYPQHS